MNRKKKRGKPKTKLRGRPPLVDPQVVIGSADMYGSWLRQYWPKLGRRMLDANSAEEISQAIQQEASGVSASLAPFSALMLAIIHDRRFPRVRSEAQIQFLADSLGAQDRVTARRSREICAQERKKVKHVIVRKEYYIECSCGYKGPARDGACRNCGTAELSWDLLVREQV